MKLLVKPEILTSYIYIYIYISYPVAQLCVSTLLATKVPPITDGISFGTLRVKRPFMQGTVSILHNVFYFTCLYVELASSKVRIHLVQNDAQ
jgi:hypothetical protein